MFVLVHPLTELQILGLAFWYFDFNSRGRVTHICISKLPTIGSDNGLSPDHAKLLSEPMPEYC